jgi:drug/metabolite transporter (DMT)-like permease
MNLNNSAHLHVLLNHWPIVGLAIATLGLLLAIFTRNRVAQIISLSLVIFTSATAWPVYATGEKAYKTIRGVADEDGADWLDTHLERADATVGYFALPPVLALLAIFLPRKFPRSSSPLLWLTLLASVVCLGLGAYIAEAGGQIRHPEFRSPESPPAP